MPTAVLSKEGADEMAFETKVILTLLLQQVGMSDTVKQAYELIAAAANVEGIEALSYEEFLKKIGKEKNEN